MQTYIFVKSFIMLAALGSAFTIFYQKVKRLYQLMMAVDGKTEFKLDRVKERVAVIFKDVLGQSNVRRKPLAGLSHMLIFFGFLAVQPHSLELMIKGVCPAFDVAHLSPGVYGAYLYAADILAPLVLVGFAYATYRRALVRPKYLTLGIDANLIILFTCVIIITFMFINAFQSLMPSDFNYAAVFPVSVALAGFFGLNTLTPQQVIVGYEVCYWIHMATILGFLVYIPGSKHLHLLAAAPNVFMKPLEREKAMIKTDIEDEEAENFGLGNVNDLS